MNAFDRFDITHLSPSQLNLWQTSPGLYALRYIAKIKDAGSPAMWRGTAVENGLAALLNHLPLEKAIAMAMQSYELNAQKAEYDLVEYAQEGELITPMLKQLTYWQPPGPLNATQLRVEAWLDPTPVPIIGYPDFCFEEVDIDLKTTKAMPSKPRSEHIRQAALYRYARERRGGILYVTAKRNEYYEIDDDTMNEAIAELRASALSLQNFLSRMESRDEILRSLPIDYGHYQAPRTKIPLSEILTAGG